MYIVDIDTGGTMTDCLVTGDGALVSCKVDTTPHDYTVSFHACLEEAARLLGFENSAALLDRVELIRWSSTITSNVLGERRGAKAGLLVREGHERDLYGPDTSPALGWLVAEHNVLGLPERPGIEAILKPLKQLLEKGVRRVCVCLPGAYPDDTAEVELRELIERHYPDHYLGSVPLLLGSEMMQVKDDDSRVLAALINAYTHTQLATSLFKAEDLLKDRDGWDGPLLIGQTNGGVARIGKTKAVDTIESGPVFGTYGAAHLAGLYGIDRAVCLDVGGTTSKASVSVDGRPALQRGGRLVGLPIRSRFALLRTAVLGGGSIARAAGDGLTLGPESMGASPGPACYGLGGGEATLTDAMVVLGYLSPDRFLGGRRALRTDLAEQAIAARVAGPLDLPIREAAERVFLEAVDMIAGLVSATLAEAGIDAQATSLIAYGGNGPLFGCMVARRLRIRRVLVPGLAPVLSAFGSAISDVVHVYEMGIAVPPPEASAVVEAAAARLRGLAERDLRGEGFDPAKARYEFECDGTGSGGPGTFELAPRNRSPRAVAAAVAADPRLTGIELLRLRCRVRVGRYRAAEHPVRTTRRVGAACYRNLRVAGAEHEAGVVDWGALEGGDRIRGPAVVVGDSLTCLVPAGLEFLYDGFGNGQIQ